jgi:hypothetical protein
LPLSASIARITSFSSWRENVNTRLPTTIGVA